MPHCGPRSLRQSKARRSAKHTSSMQLGWNTTGWGRSQAPARPTRFGYRGDRDSRRVTLASQLTRLISREPWICVRDGPHRTRAERVARRIQQSAQDRGGILAVVELEHLLLRSSAGVKLQAISERFERQELLVGHGDRLARRAEHRSRRRDVHVTASDSCHVVHWHGVAARRANSEAHALRDPDRCSARAVVILPPHPLFHQDGWRAPQALLAALQVEVARHDRGLIEQRRADLATTIELVIEGGEVGPSQVELFGEREQSGFLFGGLDVISKTSIKCSVPARACELDVLSASWALLTVDETAPETDRLVAVRAGRHRVLLDHGRK